MKRLVAAAISSVVFVACAADDGPECENIGGNWTVRSERTTGTCDIATFGNQTISVTMRRDSGRWEVVLPGIEGGCPGELDPNTCRFTTTCDLLDRESRRLATSNIEWVFDGNSLTGSTISRVFNPAVVRDCLVDYRDNGTKL